MVNVFGKIPVCLVLATDALLAASKQELGKQTPSCGCIGHLPWSEEEAELSGIPQLGEKGGVSPAR